MEDIIIKTYDLCKTSLSIIIFMRQQEACYEIE
ncbi:hypothetical protein CPAST_c38520 [Clostridium pasteurianum DSM 525 = ATCC 6013]|uniref:Uncharacterized protein n=1 Tax=Clostridium pasteurianum DSM 525 = ATCC 6013 TaxID=1262449 RepID=A0A0H3JBK5_CLOPA|nr:hypothetical protein CPAST_c38520 [Clostridium pasteurianum DSM 525 = ATCC 6013]AJA53878.1 hypothetical protein CLPA_c38520 [Clostridium pasteurianum DSM 525 = ATCC 6013]KRU14097.1 hypothetical protein CP6013_03353 [Clostridium pasteurianum DSM 525 = ATCC 6013]